MHAVYNSFLNQYLSTVKRPIIFELGVNELQDTELLLNLANDPIYFGFEPDPFHIENIKKSHLFDKFNLIESAVGAFDGKCILYQSLFKEKNKMVNTGSSSIRKPKRVLEVFPHVKFEHEAKVDIVTLDKFCKDNNIKHIDFIWADIQGAEIDMILGAQEILLNTDYLFTEYSSDHEFYDGQVGLKSIMAALPGKWEIVKDYISDILLKRVG
jgi:FkbM family methyltransferase